MTAVDTPTQRKQEAHKGFCFTALLKSIQVNVEISSITGQASSFLRMFSKALGSIL